MVLERAPQRPARGRGLVGAGVGEERRPREEPLERRRPGPVLEPGLEPVELVERVDDQEEVVDLEDVAALRGVERPLEPRRQRRREAVVRERQHAPVAGVLRADQPVELRVLFARGVRVRRERADVAAAAEALGAAVRRAAVHERLEDLRGLEALERLCNVGGERRLPRRRFRLGGEAFGRDDGCSCC